MAKNPQEGGGGESRVCPVCSTGKSGPSSTLILRQINATEAIYVCSNPNCVYPVGQEVVTVERTLREMMPDYQESSPPEENGKQLQNVFFMICITFPHAAGDQYSLECKSGPQDQAPSDNWFNTDDFLDPDIGDWLDSQTY